MKEKKGETYSHFIMEKIFSFVKVAHIAKPTTLQALAALGYVN